MAHALRERINRAVDKSKTLQLICGVASGYVAGLFGAALPWTMTTSMRDSCNPTEPPLLRRSMYATFAATAIALGGLIAYGVYKDCVNYSLLLPFIDVSANGIGYAIRKKEKQGLNSLEEIF